MMKEIRKRVLVNRYEYYKTHLYLMNCVLPVKFAPKEIEVLASFMSLSGDIAKDRFGTSARKMVKENLNITAAGMSNYIRFLKNKGFLKIGEDGKYTILPILFPEEKEQFYQFRLINTDDTDSR